jgi:alpha-tubulin suppressor-like RCC1 family protein
VLVIGIGDAVDVAVGDAFSCGLTDDGTVKCWGLGFGNTAKDVEELSAIDTVDAGGTHACVLTSAGAVKCWGANSLGQVGDGQQCGVVCPTPVEVSGLDHGVDSLTRAGA